MYGMVRYVTGLARISDNDKDGETSTTTKPTTRKRPGQALETALESMHIHSAALPVCELGPRAPGCSQGSLVLGEEWMKPKADIFSLNG